MGTKINIANLELGQLNSECVSVITMFARELEQQKGVVIMLTDEHLIRQIIRHAHDSPSQKLEALYLRLKVAIKKLINSADFNLNDYENKLITDNLETGSGSITTKTKPLNGRHF